MKTRQGFVSNSSSSSFIILKKDESLSVEELKERSRKTYSREGEKEIEKWAGCGQYVLFSERVEYGAEESIDELIPKLLDAFGIDASNISLEWGE